MDRDADGEGDDVVDEGWDKEAEEGNEREREDRNEGEGEEGNELNPEDGLQDLQYFPNFYRLLKSLDSGNETNTCTDTSFHTAI